MKNKEHYITDGERIEWLDVILEDPEVGDWIDKLNNDDRWEMSKYFTEIVRKAHKQGLRQGFEKVFEIGKSKSNPSTYRGKITPK